MFEIVLEIVLEIVFEIVPYWPKGFERLGTRISERSWEPVKTCSTQVGLKRLGGELHPMTHTYLRGFTLEFSRGWGGGGGEGD